MSFIINLLVSGGAVLLASFFTPGVNVDGLWIAILVAIVLALVNATIGSIIRLLTLPLNILTFGLVGAIIGLLMILLTAALVPGFSIDNRASGLVFAVLLGLISALFGIIVEE